MIDQGTVWVCTDCYMAHHYGEPTTTEEGLQPMSLLVDFEVTDGLPANLHECSAAELASGDCQCGELNFSKTPCEGCGSTLAGAREALTLWSQEVDEAERDADLRDSALITRDDADRGR